jgi:hypothetical protein
MVLKFPLTRAALTNVDVNEWVAVNREYTLLALVRTDMRIMRALADSFARLAVKASAISQAVPSEGRKGKRADIHLGKATMVLKFPLTNQHQQQQQQQQPPAGQGYSNAPLPRSGNGNGQQPTNVKANVPTYIWARRRWF